MSATVEIVGARRTFSSEARRPQLPALDGVDLTVAAGELLVVMGPSGAGKSTLLRAIAGLERLDGGTIRIGGRDVTSLPPGDRNVAMVFQHPALYPHLSVEANIGFGLRARRLGKQVVRERVRIAAGALSLVELLDRRPDELSGGERQRVGLARALVRNASVFLMDEPLTSLDSELRSRARTEIRELHEQTAATMVYVTHDSQEALALGQRIAVLRAGRLEQIGTPIELFDHPATAFVGWALGEPRMNIVPSTVLPAPDGKPWSGIRPAQLHIVDGPEWRNVVDPTVGVLQGDVVGVELAGSEIVVDVRVQGETIVVRHARPSGTPHGEVSISYRTADVRGFDAGP